MKLKKTTQDTIESSIELLSGQTFDQNQFERIKKLYYQDKPQDPSKAGLTEEEFVRVLVEYTDEIIHAYEIRLAWTYDQHGNVIHGEMNLADLYQPPMINDSMLIFYANVEQITIDHSVFDFLKDKPLLNIQPQEEFFEIDLIPALFLGAYETIVQNLEKVIATGHLEWMLLMN